MGTRFIEGFTFNLFSVFLLAYVVTNLELPKSWALNGIMVGAALGVVLVPITGALSDRVGRKPVFRAGAWVALADRVPGGRAGPERDAGVGIFVALVAGLGLVYGMVYGPLAAWWSELFDTRYRYTALSLALPDLRHRRVRPDAADRGVAGHARRRDAVVGRRLQRGRRRDQPDRRARFLPETQGRDLDEDWVPVDAPRGRVGAGCGVGAPAPRDPRRTGDPCNFSATGTAEK